MSNIIRAKCLVLGDSAVGKTALMQTFMTENSQFSKNYNMTMGLDIVTKLIHVPDTESSVELFLYDCSGKEFYRGLVKKMSSHPSLLLLMYDVTSENSFNLLNDFYEMVKSESQGETVKGVLFANKTDLAARRVISPKMGREAAERFGLPYFEGSVKDQQGIEEPFFFLVNEWFKTYTDKIQALKVLT